MNSANSPEPASPSDPAAPTTPSSVKDRPATIVVGLIISFLMRLIYYTSRKRFVCKEHMMELMAQKKPLILASWHDRIILSPFTYIRFQKNTHKLVPLASASKDGAIAAWAMRGLGLHCARGSSSRGGTKALREMLTLLKNGKDLAFTPDGPRGPRHVVQGGVILAAKLSGAPIIPVSFQARRRKMLNSWDRMIVPYPFNDLVFAYGPPLFVPKDLPVAEVELYCNKLGEELLRVDQIAEQLADGLQPLPCETQP